MERYDLTVQRGEETAVLRANPQASILSTLRGEDYTEPDAPCGGQGTCRKCTVTVTGRVRSLEGFGERDVVEEPLLACRYAPAGDCLVVLTQKEKMNVVTAGAGALAGGGDGLGFAVDLGTTTVASFL